MSKTTFLLLTALLAFLRVLTAEPMKVILDTDIGDDIDDAWALAFLISHEEFEPVGVTIAHGNTPGRARVACKMLRQTGRGNIPVAVGRKTGSRVGYQFTWAEDFEALKPSGQSAARRSRTSSDL